LELIKLFITLGMRSQRHKLGKASPETENDHNSAGDKDDEPIILMTPPRPRLQAANSVQVAVEPFAEIEEIQENIAQERAQDLPRRAAIINPQPQNFDQADQLIDNIPRNNLRQIDPIPPIDDQIHLPLPEDEGFQRGKFFICFLKYIYINKVYIYIDLGLSD